MAPVHKEDSLPAVAAAWAALLPTAPPHPVVPPAEDPASAAAAAGMAAWPELHEMLGAELERHAAQLVAAANVTNAVIDAADEANATDIAGTGL